MNTTDQSGITDFRRACDEILLPAVRGHGLSVVDRGNRIIVMAKPGLCLKVYLPECHGHDVTITLAPSVTKTWNSADELGLPWFARYFGLPQARHARVSTVQDLPQLAV